MGSRNRIKVPERHVRLQFYCIRKILGELTIAKYAGGNLALSCRQSRWNRRSGLSRTKDGVSAQPRFCGFYLSCAVVTG